MNFITMLYIKKSVFLKLIGFSTNKFFNSTPLRVVYLNNERDCECVKSNQLDLIMVMIMVYFCAPNEWECIEFNSQAWRNFLTFVQVADISTHIRISLLFAHVLYSRENIQLKFKKLTSFSHSYWFFQFTVFRVSNLVQINCIWQWNLILSSPVFRFDECLFYLVLQLRAKLNVFK